MKSAPSIGLDYAPSRRIALAIGLVATLAIIAALICALPWALRLAIAVAAAGYGFWSIRRQQQPAWRHIAYGAAGWSLLHHDGSEHAATLCRHARIGPLLTLDFKVDDGTRFRPVFAGDNLDAERERKLVLLLARAEVTQTDRSA